jgi:hypothetical protein
MADTTPTSKPKENHAVPISREKVRAMADFAGTTIETVLERLASLFTADLLKSIAEELKAEQAASSKAALHEALGLGGEPLRTQEIGNARRARGNGLTPDGGIPTLPQTDQRGGSSQG